MNQPQDQADKTPAGTPEPTHQDPQQPDETWPVADELVTELEKLRAERDERNQAYLRTLADFQNYQRRALLNEQTARVEGVSKVVERIFGVLDHFDLALGQDTSKASAEQIIHGVKLIRDEFSKVLASLGVGLINPQPNDEFVPGRHEAVMQQPAEGVEPGRVVACFQPGYTLNAQTGERVLRAAKVSVSP